MKIFLGVSVLFLIINNVSGQFINRVNCFNKPIKHYELNQNDTSVLLDPFEKKLKIRMEIGAGFGTGFNNYNFTNTFVSPQFFYNVSPKLSLNGGMILGKNNFINSSNELTNYFPAKGNFSYTYLYGEGQYQINNRLTIRGMFYRESNIQNGPEINPRAFNFENHGMTMEFQYMINENFSIGGGFGVSKGNFPYYNERRQLSDPFMFDINKIY